MQILKKCKFLRTHKCLPVLVNSLQIDVQCAFLTNTCKFLHIMTNSYTFWQILTHSDKFLHILTNSYTFWQILTISKFLTNFITFLQSSTNVYLFLQILTLYCKFVLPFLQIVANSLQVDIQVSFLRILTNCYKLLEILKCFTFSGQFFHIFGKSYKLLQIHTKSCNWFVQISYTFL